MGNDKVEEIWRAPYMPSGDIEGYRVYKGFHADGTPLEPQEWPLARAIATGEEVHDEEIPFERGDGTCGVVLNNAAPIYDQEGRITAAVVVFQDVTDRKQAEAERERLLAELQTLTETLEQRVAARTAQTRMLASALSVAEARERERLARVLHDDLQQLLYSELIRLEMLVAGLEQDKPLNFRELVTGMKELMHRAVDVTRALVTQMNAPAVASDRVGEAVEWLAQQMKELHGLEVTITGDGAVRMASRERRALLLELIRELLFNIVKHAGVKQARVMLEQKDGMLVVRVEDDGTGFDVTAVQGQDAVPPQLGLFSVAQRLQVIGGQLEIESTPGDGTLVSMAMPIR
jgi:two-component system CheB/CheR fusion protein